MSRFDLSAARQVGAALQRLPGRLSAWWAQTGPSASAGGPSAGSHGDPATRNWNPGLYEANAELRYSRGPASARARDLERSDGWAAAGLSRQVDALAAGGFRLSAQVDGLALGLDADQTAALNSQIERLWREHAESAFFFVDLHRAQTWSQLVSLSWYHRLRDGEALGVVAWRSPGTLDFGTRLAVVDPDRLSNPQGRSDTATLRQGVELDGDGTPTAYHLSDAHPNDPHQQRSWTRWSRWDAQGLPVVLHDFARTRAGQVRGVSVLAPVLRTFKQLGRYTDAELDAALVNALFALTVETSESPAEVAERLSVRQASDSEADRARFYAQNPVRVQGVRATLLRPGDKLTLNAGSRQTRDASAFESALLTRVAATLGLSLEQLTGDWSRTSYSSARAGALQTARWLRARRTEHKARFVAPFYLVWLAEAFDRGFLQVPQGAPSFEAYPEAYARADWLTPGPGWVDPVKEVDGAQRRVALGLSTLREECAEQGRDWQEVAAQLQREVQAYKALGLTHPAERALGPSAPDVPEPAPAVAPR